MSALDDIARNRWVWTEEGRDRRQEHAIGELARRQRRQALESEERQREAQLRLEGRIDAASTRLSERIETLFAWTDLRFRLLEFEEYEARKHIRNAFRALAEGRPARLPDLHDLPGYWLLPAASATLPLVLRGRPAGGTVPPADLTTGLAAARARDAVRAELFNLAVGRCFGQAVLVDAAFLRLIADAPDLGAAEPGQVADGWRGLWEQAALGEFGPAAAVQLTGRLRELFAPGADGSAPGLDETDVKEWDRAIEAFGSVGGAEPPLAEALVSLRLHLTAETAGELPDLDGRWRRCLQDLIEEPSPAELPLVRRLEDLAVGEAPLRSRPAWAESAGTAAELIRRDVFDPETPIALRRMALDLAAPLLRARLDRLLEAMEAPAPAVVAVKRRGGSVDVTAAGHDADEAAALEDRIGRGFDTDGPSKPRFTAAGAGLLALAAAVAAIGLWGLAVPVALGALIPLLMYRGDAKKARREAEKRDAQIADLRAALFAARADASAADQKRAAAHLADRTALERLITALPGSD
ncbi:hypothetical protein ACFQS3_04665 [Glycomyces mayteni]|uniref:Uncharacterized protein n=1 Tax=Glycomyces mayteni TaxID=543887 RepID=A0ABW2D2E8_9ACTN|nr:hypothetical protein GCM10025732_53070 [Glycomyces mayteni]